MFALRFPIFLRNTSSRVVLANYPTLTHLLSVPSKFWRLPTRPMMTRDTKVNIDFHLGIQPVDPTQKIPILIVGNVRLIKLLQFDDVQTKIGPFVTPEVFKLALENLQPNPSDVCSLYLNQISIAGFLDNATHYNSTAQPHLITKIIKSVATGQNCIIIVVCEKKNIFASGCAVVRAFPLYCRKTHRSSDMPTMTHSNYHVEFLVFKGDELIASSECSTPELRNVTKTLKEVAYGIQLTARIVDTPCCDMNTEMFLEEIKDVAKKLKITPFVIGGEDLKDQGFGGMYAVGKAAACKPLFVVLSHTVSNATDTIAWVGKGIVYDTGGLCIKGRTSMPGMKRDCGGAAAILGAFYAAVKRGFKQNLHAIFCLAENAVGPLSTKPDDVFRLYSGRTVEINNTDAEGRLVLADGVAYAQTNLKANIILDMATLTGAQSVSTGKYHAAVMSNYQSWEQLVVQAGIESGDLAFPIPFCPELHFSEFTSAVADMKNSCADRTNALASCAGLFIASHLGFDTKTTWIHVDIAGVAYSGERATGYGVALLLTLFGNLSNDDHLQYLCPNKNKIISSSGEPNSTMEPSSSKKQRTN